MNTTNSTLSSGTYEYQKEEINLSYAICEVLVAVFAVIGNALVIFVFRKERRLRRRTNYYIVSLAAADLLVGLLGIPFAIMSSIGLPTNLHACLFTVSLLVVLCTISIFCLVAVSVDRYWAILHPMGYSRNVSTKTAIVIISICWVTGSIIGFLPLMGWHKDAPSNGRCFFLGVMDYNYLVFLYFGTIITPALLLAAFYAHIYQVVLKQLRRIVTMDPENGASRSCSSGGTMLRMLGAAQKREVKATQNLAIIVLFFMICWIPLYTINCILAFCRDCKVNPTFMFSCIILSHLNSAGNPLLYAYHLRDFRSALKNFFCNLFDYSEPTQNQSRSVNCNLNHFRVSQTDGRTVISNNSQIHFRKKITVTPPKIATTIVKNSTVVAAATTGETNREIWNIPEGSTDSSESLKHIEPSEKISIVRPATPYRPRKTSQVNQAYTETSSFEEENDDVFVDETLPFSEFNYKSGFEINLTDRKHEIKIASKSSPQLSRNLFFVESGTTRPKFVRSCSFAEKTVSNDSNNCDLKMTPNKISPFKVVGGMFRNKNTLGRSLSDVGTTSTESIARKSNGTVIRSSCGS